MKFFRAGKYGKLYVYLFTRWHSKNSLVTCDVGYHSNLIDAQEWSGRQVGFHVTVNLLGINLLWILWSHTVSVEWKGKS